MKRIILIIIAFIISSGEVHNIVGRSVPSVFEKGRDSELYETWRMFKKMVKDNQRRIRKDNSIIPKTSIEYRFSIK